MCGHSLFCVCPGCHCGFNSQGAVGGQCGACQSLPHACRLPSRLVRGQPLCRPPGLPSGPISRSSARTWFGKYVYSSHLLPPSLDVYRSRFIYKDISPLLYRNGIVPYIHFATCLFHTKYRLCPAPFPHLHPRCCSGAGLGSAAPGGRGGRLSGQWGSSAAGILG